MLTNPVSKIFVILAVLTTALLTVSFVDRGDPSNLVSNAEAYQIFRRGEIQFPMRNAQAYRLFRLGEWAAADTPNLNAYHHSERARVIPNSGLAIYHMSERSLTGLLADLTAYFQSERTLLSGRSLDRFSDYQRSEWFGK